MDGRVKKARFNLTTIGKVEVRKTKILKKEKKNVQ